MVNSKENASQRLLALHMNGYPVGQLNKATDGGMSFQYDKNWLQRPGKRPISLSLPTEPAFHSNQAVYNFFDNLLPDNPALRTHIQQRFGVSSNHPFDLLEAIGKDCIGAIQLLPSGQAFNIRQIIGKPLSTEELVERIQANRNAPLGMSKSHEDFRISLAGAQEKTALLWHKDSWHSPEGTTPTTHIIKLPIGKIDHNAIDLSESVDNEWLCLKILELYGLQVAQTERIRIGDTTVLAVERFDRRLSGDKSWWMRLPQEDMCQALGYSPGLKYQADGGPGMAEIMELLRGSSNPEKDQRDFFKANFLFWLMAAPDGHAKNFSIYLQPGGSYQLTPIYDVLSLYPLIASGGIQKKRIKMAMALQGKNRHYHWHKLMLRHVFSIAEHCSFPRDKALGVVQETLFCTGKVLDKAQQLLPEDFSDTVSQPILSGLRQTSERMKQQMVNYSW